MSGNVDTKLIGDAYGPVRGMIDARCKEFSLIRLDPIYHALTAEKVISYIGQFVKNELPVKGEIFTFFKPYQMIQESKNLLSYLAIIGAEKSVMNSTSRLINLVCDIPGGNFERFLESKFESEDPKNYLQNLTEMKKLMDQDMRTNRGIILMSEPVYVLSNQMESLAEVLMR